MTKSIRHQILDNMLEAFRAVTVGSHGVAFSLVELGPLDDNDFKKRYSIGVVPRGERFVDQFPLLFCWFTVGIEYRITVNQGDPKPVALSETILKVVKQVLLANPGWGGLAIDTKLVNNEVDVQSYGDRSVMGVQFIEIEYRHSRRDPTDPDPTV